MNFRHRGIFLTDAMMGLAIVVILATLLAVSLNRENRISQRFAETRAAVRLAESAVAELRAGNDPAKLDPSARINLRRLKQASEIPGQVWIEVDVRLPGAHETLAALVPEPAALKAGVKP